jgi:hypothetical protein
MRNDRNSDVLNQHAYAERVADEEEAAPALEVHFPPELQGGVWANYAQVSHSPYEFTLDFARLDFGQATPERVPGTVVARVNVSPLLISQLMEALQINWERYAERALPKEARDEHDEA